MAPAAPAAAERPVVRPRDLMTTQERQAYRQAMREARTPEARQATRDRLYTTLRQRATERGVVLAEPGMKKPGAGKEMRMSEQRSGENRWNPFWGRSEPAPRPASPPRAP
ncbi:hypothetical protein CCP1ISM_2650002 [Azospirillaceae bacterium]